MISKIKTIAKAYGNILLKPLGLELAKKTTLNKRHVSLQKYLHEYAARDQVHKGFLEHLAVHIGEDQSQLFQDIFVDFIMDGKERGVYCEFGATDGVALSNTLWLEQHRDWTGILVEPAKHWQRELIRNRPKAIVDSRCVYHETGDVVQFNEAIRPELSTIDAFSESDRHRHQRETSRSYGVETVSLHDLLSEYDLDVLDYLSVDTEGSEYPILANFDLHKWRPSIVTVEHNYTKSQDRIFSLMINNGYTRVFEVFSMNEDWYIEEDLWKEVRKQYSQRA